MAHNCFISFKKEDQYYKERILEKLGEERIQGKALDRWIDSDDIDYVMQTIRREYMSNSTVTLFLIGRHSSENEGCDWLGRNNQSFMIRELQATLYDREGDPRDGLLGIVLPEMEATVFGGRARCLHCGELINIINLDDSVVLREFSENYWLRPNRDGCHYCEEGRFAVLCRYSQFMNDPESFIDKAYNKTREPISHFVHFRDIKHKFSIK